ncbi:MAG: 3-phosphoshikimate 1-carboxyvinyltransferase [Flavobacterium sp.]|nr:3-phosphoshikimate 1-carboxyvinyltransferase [Flavobacterium sp.]
MNLLLHSQFIIKNSQLKITGSKSETNRLLLLQALYPNITLKNTSNSDDSDVMIYALHLPFAIQHSRLVDVHHAGTAMRFLTAYFAIQEGKEIILTGSSRMKQRPIKILVEALNQLGAEILYAENDGFPPIKIIGKKLNQSKISLPANVSSQYISALLLIAPKLENGLELTLEGEITSIPYIKMTLALLNEIGVTTSFVKNKISIKPATNNQQPTTMTIESDWSSASYWYSIIALSEIRTQVTLSSYKENSLQGDAVLVEIYKNFGVETTFSESVIIIKKIEYITKSVQFNLASSPDIAQTIVVTCFGLGVGCLLTGLHTLKIKETDRIEALRLELTKLGALVITTDSTLKLGTSTRINSNIKITTYQDHRMAMAFAPLALKVPISIENAEVVSKSYPTFWDDLKTVGFQISEH